MNRLIAVSGGFDPIHEGHIQMLEHAEYYGDVVVILNSDAWLIRKKGAFFQPYEVRKKIIESIRYVSFVVPAYDEDGTVCENLRELKPHYFANGGDRERDNTPEVKICLELGIDCLWGLGGHNVTHSSQLLKRWASLVSSKTNPSSLGIL